MFYYMYNWLITISYLDYKVLLLSCLVFIIILSKVHFINKLCFYFLNYVLISPQQMFYNWFYSSALFGRSSAYERSFFMLLRKTKILSKILGWLKNKNIDRYILYKNICILHWRFDELCRVQKQLIFFYILRSFFLLLYCSWVFFKNLIFFFITINNYIFNVYLFIFYILFNVWLFVLQYVNLVIYKLIFQLYVKFINFLLIYLFLPTHFRIFKWIILKSPYYSRFFFRKTYNSYPLDYNLNFYKYMGYIQPLRFDINNIRFGNIYLITLSWQFSYYLNLKMFEIIKVWNNKRWFLSFLGRFPLGIDHIYVTHFALTVTGKIKALPNVYGYGWNTFAIKCLWLFSLFQGLLKYEQKIKNIYRFKLDNLVFFYYFCILQFQFWNKERFLWLILFFFFIYIFHMFIIFLLWIIVFLYILDIQISKIYILNFIKFVGFFFSLPFLFIKNFIKCIFRLFIIYLLRFFFIIKYFFILIFFSFIIVYMHYDFSFIFSYLNFNLLSIFVNKFIILWHEFIKALPGYDYILNVYNSHLYQLILDGKSTLIKNNFLNIVLIGNEFSLLSVDVLNTYITLYKLSPYFFIYNLDGDIVGFNFKIIKTFFYSGYSLNELSYIFYYLFTLDFKILFLFRVVYTYFYDFVLSSEYFIGWFFYKCYLVLNSLYLWHFLYIKIFWCSDFINIIKKFNIFYYIFSLKEFYIIVKSTDLFLFIFFDFLFIKFINEHGLYWYIHSIYRFLEYIFFQFNNVFLLHLTTFLYRNGVDILIFMINYWEFNLTTFLYQKSLDFQYYIISFWDSFFYQNRIAIGKFSSSYSYNFAGFFYPPEEDFHNKVNNLFRSYYCSIFDGFLIYSNYKHNFLLFDNYIYSKNDFKNLIVNYFFFDITQKNLILCSYIFSIVLWIYFCLWLVNINNLGNLSYNFNNEYLWFKFRKSYKSLNKNWWEYNKHYFNFKRFVNKMDNSKIVDNKIFMEITKIIKNLYFYKRYINIIVDLSKFYKIYSINNLINWKDLNFRILSKNNILSFNNSLISNFNLNLKKNLKLYFLFLYRYTKFLKRKYKLYVDIDYSDYILESNYSSFHETRLANYYLLYLFISYSYDKTIFDNNLLQRIFWQESDIYYLNMDSSDLNENNKIYKLNNRFYYYLLFFDNKINNNFYNLNWLWYKDSGNFLFVKNPNKVNDFHVIDNHVILSDRFLIIFLILIWFGFIILQYYKISFLFEFLNYICWSVSTYAIDTFVNTSDNLEGPMRFILGLASFGVNEHFLADKNSMYWYRYSESRLLWCSFDFLKLNLKSFFFKFNDFFYLYTATNWSFYLNLMQLSFLIINFNYFVKVRKLKGLQKQNVKNLQKIIKNLKIRELIFKKSLWY